MVITSSFRIPLQAVKKQNIVYSGRLSVTNALPVFGTCSLSELRLSHERRKIPAGFEGNSGVMQVLNLKSDSYSLIHNTLLMID